MNQQGSQVNEEVETVNQSKIKKSVQTYKSIHEQSCSPLVQQLHQKQYVIDSQQISIIKLTDVYQKMADQYKQLEEKFALLTSHAEQSGLDVQGIFCQKSLGLRSGT